MSKTSEWLLFCFWLTIALMRMRVEGSWDLIIEDIPNLEVEPKWDDELTGQLLFRELLQVGNEINK